MEPDPVPPPPNQYAHEQCSLMNGLAEVACSPTVVTVDHGGKPMVDSRDVARHFGKEHKHVLRDIRNLIEITPEIRSNFGPLFLGGTAGRVSHHLMDRDGFALLAMGFTGREAIRWKLAYIKAFNRMEAIIRAGLEEEKRLAIAKVDELAPKAAFYDDVRVSQGLLTFDEAAKEIGIGRNTLIRQLRDRGVLTKQRDYSGKFSNTPKQQYVQRGLFRVIPKVSKPDVYGRTHTYQQTFVTPKGLTRLWETMTKRRAAS